MLRRNRCLIVYAHATAGLKTGAVLALDVGTTALKAALVTPSGELLARASETYTTGTQSGPGGKVEQQPDDWVEAAGRAATAVIADALLGGRVEVLAIALSGQMQDVVLVADGLCMVAASMTTAGGNVEWARRLLLPQDASLAEFDQLATRADPGSGGVIYMPHLQGERSPFTDPSARAGFLNISADTTAAELARSVLEGTALNYAALADCMSLPLGEPLPVVGGGANSALWMQTLSDCLQRPLLPQPDADAVAARGWQKDDALAASPMAARTSSGR
eukprot:jgi/Tetstr1/425934/TSEL_016286.t1